MRVELVNLPLPCSIDDRMDIPLGLLYIATLLRAHGHDARITDLTGVPEARWCANIPTADVVGMTIYTPLYKAGVRLARRLKDARPGVVCVAGGPHPDALPDQIDDVFDHVVTGEGEWAMLELVGECQAGRTSSRVHAGGQVPDLDALPAPDRSLVDLGSYHRIVDGQRSVALVTSRGCPWTCAYCHIGSLPNPRIRFRSIDRVLEEIGSVIDRYGIRHFVFHDDTFTVHRRRMATLCRQLEPLGIRFRANSMVYRNDPSDFEALVRAGCRTISYGVESASEFVLHELFRKPIDQRMIANAIENAQAAGLRVRIYLLVGFPGQTMEHIRETADFLQQHPPDQWCVNTFVPYPGSTVWNNPEKYQAQIATDFDEFVFLKGDQDGGRAITTPTMSREDVRQQRAYLVSRMRELPWRGDRQLYHDQIALLGIPERRAV